MLRIYSTGSSGGGGGGGGSRGETRAQGLNAQMEAHQDGQVGQVMH